MIESDIIKDLEQQIENLKITIKLKDDIIDLYKNKQDIVNVPFGISAPLQTFNSYTGDVIPNPIEITS